MKPGVRSVAFVAAPGEQAVVDFEGTALREGTMLHRRIKDGLVAAGINLVPLMLVQVDSTKDSVARVKTKLLGLGFTEAQIATHTSDEPDANLLALAVNEEKEVLIFKMAVALGFDAPRAFTLVSMRGIADTDFGTQIVGRILRVHPRCQGRELPPLLQHAYVFLADCEAQAGLSTAAQKVNQIKTELAKVSPYAVIVSVAGNQQLQIVKNGQTWLLPAANMIPTEATATGETLAGNQVVAFSQPVLLDLLEGTASAPPGGSAATGGGTNAAGGGAANSQFSYPLRSGVPREFLTQRIMAVTEDLARNIAQAMRLDDNALLAGVRDMVEVVRREQEVFSVAEENQRRIQAELDLGAAEIKAQGMLLELGVVDPRDLHRELIGRLRDAYQATGKTLANEDALESALALILTQQPRLLRDAKRQAMGAFAESVASGPLPDKISSDAPLAQSAKNVYRVMPGGMNTWETAFAELLDQDTDGIVLWWHRNEPHKPWSVATTLPDGRQFFPDFLVGVKGRSKPDGVLLVDTKRAINDDLNAKVKAVVEHKAYGRAAILFYQEERRWMIVRYNEAADKNELDATFTLTLMVSY